MPFNLGPFELVIILVVVLLLFGAKRIPEIAGSMGKGIREFKRNISEATREVTDATSQPPQERIPPPPPVDEAVARDADREPKRLIQ